MQSPPQLGGTSVTVSVYVQDVDAFARRAEDAGATLLRPVADQSTARGLRPSKIPLDTSGTSPP